MSAKPTSRAPIPFATLVAAKAKDAFVSELNPRRVKGRHGEPRHWDGLSSLFVLLAARSPRALTTTERKWLEALRTAGATTSLDG